MQAFLLPDILLPPLHRDILPRTFHGNGLVLQLRGSHTKCFILMVSALVLLVGGVGRATAGVVIYSGRLDTVRTFGATQIGTTMLYPKKADRSTTSPTVDEVFVLIETYIGQLFQLVELNRGKTRYKLREAIGT